MLGRFFEFLKKTTFFYFLRLIFVFVYMGPYGSPVFKMLLLLQTAAKSFQTFTEVSFQTPHKTTFLIFEILKIEILTKFFFIFVNMGPNGSEISERYSSYKSSRFQTSPEFSSQWS